MLEMNNDSDEDDDDDEEGKAHRHHVHRSQTVDLVNALALRPNSGTYTESLGSSRDKRARRHKRKGTGKMVKTSKSRSKSPNFRKRMKLNLKKAREEEDSVPRIGKQRSRTPKAGRSRLHRRQRSKSTTSIRAMMQRGLKDQLSGGKAKTDSNSLSHSLSETHTGHTDEENDPEDSLNEADHAKKGPATLSSTSTKQTMARIATNELEEEMESEYYVEEEVVLPDRQSLKHAYSQSLATTPSRSVDTSSRARSVERKVRKVRAKEAPTSSPQLQFPQIAQLLRDKNRVKPWVWNSKNLGRAEEYRYHRGTQHPLGIGVETVLNFRYMHALMHPNQTRHIGDPNSTTKPNRMGKDKVTVHTVNVRKLKLESYVVDNLKKRANKPITREMAKQPRKSTQPLRSKSPKLQPRKRTHALRAGTPGVNFNSSQRAAAVQPRKLTKPDRPPPAAPTQSPYANVNTKQNK